MSELVGKSKLQGLLIFVEDEDLSLDVDIPTHKVEKGINISDHVERKPKVVKISGLLVRPTANRVETLVGKIWNYERKGKLVTYEGRRIYKNMLISNFNIKATSKVKNGYTFSLTLTEVRVAQSSYVPPKQKAVTAKKSKAGRKQTVNKKQTGIVHTVKRGDTYAGLAKKYGVTIASLQKLNKYSAKNIPIGAKLKIK